MEPMSMDGGFTVARQSKSTRYIIIAATSLVTVFLVYLWAGLTSLPVELRNGYLNNIGSHSFLPPSNLESQCVDPYRRPGYLFIDSKTSHARYIPYNDNFLDAEDPPAAKYPYDAEANGELFFSNESVPEARFLDHALTPTDWMTYALDGARSRRNKSEPKNLEEPGSGSNQMGWLDGRVVLFISDSIDRYNVQYFCGEFKDTGADPGAKFTQGQLGHSIAGCYVPSLNLTLLHWHLAGMINYNPKWWWDEASKKDVPFEMRWNTTWSQTFGNITSINGKGPDLVLWQSNVWDRKNWRGMATDHYGENSPMATPERPLVWDEIRFYAARAKTLLQFLRDKLGQDTPMMLRTLTLDRDNPHRDIQTYEMDRLSRVIGQKYGIETFEWGKILAGHVDLYRDFLHLDKGPASWLWANMVLEYLARAVGAGTKGGARPERERYFSDWRTCHEILMRAQE